MADTDNEPSKKPRKNSVQIKTLLIMLTVLVIEGAAISAAFVLYSGPSAVKADGAEEDPDAMPEQPVEELVVSGNFPNTKRGRTYLYDTEIYVVIRRKHQEHVRQQLDDMSAQVSANIREIIGRAEPNHLLEPTLATLRRQIKASLDDLLGMNEERQSRIDRIVITRFTQFRADL